MSDIRAIGLALIALSVGCDTSAPPPPPPPAPPSPPPGGPCEYEEQVLSCLPVRVELSPGGLTLHYPDIHGWETSPVRVQVPDDQIERARRHYMETGAACTARVITRGSCPPILDPAVTPPPLPPGE